MRTAQLLIVAMAWLSSVGMPQDEAVRVMPLGDSLTVGIGAPGGYRTRLYNMLQGDGIRFEFVGTASSNKPTASIDFDHEGHNGYHIGGIQANAHYWIDQEDPDIILLMIGTNDVIVGNNLPAAPFRLGMLVDSLFAYAPDVFIYVATIPPVTLTSTTNQDSRIYNQGVRQEIQARAIAGDRVQLVDIYEVMGDAQLIDNIHPNKRGYNRMADAWFDVIVHRMSLWPYCEQSLASGRLDAIGSTSLSSNDLTLWASNVPNGNGTFFYGHQADVIPFGAHQWCVGGEMTRVADALAVGGVMSAPFDVPFFSAWSGPFMVGTTLFFQATYMDVGPSGPSYAYTNGLMVTMRP